MPWVIIVTDESGESHAHGLFPSEASAYQHAEASGFELLCVQVRQIISVET